MQGQRHHGAPGLCVSGGFLVDFVGGYDEIRGHVLRAVEVRRSAIDPTGQIGIIEPFDDIGELRLTLGFQRHATGGHRRCDGLVGAVFLVGNLEQQIDGEYLAAARIGGKWRDVISAILDAGIPLHERSFQVEIDPWIGAAVAGVKIIEAHVRVVDLLAGQVAKELEK